VSGRNIQSGMPAMRYPVPCHHEAVALIGVLQYIFVPLISWPGMHVWLGGGPFSWERDKIVSQAVGIMTPNLLCTARGPVLCWLVTTPLVGRRAQITNTGSVSQTGGACTIDAWVRCIQRPTPNTWFNPRPWFKGSKKTGPLPTVHDSLYLRWMDGWIVS
jgi:hypothetical protein